MFISFHFIPSRLQVPPSAGPVYTRGSNLVITYIQWPLLLTWINFNPSMDK